MSAVTLRPATEQDADVLLLWRNDPDTRRASRSREPVSSEAHAGWLAGVLADPRRTLLVAEVSGEPVGQVRIDELGGDAYEVSVTVAPAHRGRGLGRATIEAATSVAAERFPGSLLLANVRVENDASLRAFRRAGYGDSSRVATPDMVWLQRRAG